MANHQMSRDFKGIWIPREIWLATDLHPTEKNLWAEIHSLYDRERGGCYATNEYLANFLQMTIRGVQKILQNLKNKGYINLLNPSGKQRLLVACIPTNACDVGVYGRTSPPVPPYTPPSPGTLPGENSRENKDKRKNKQKRLSVCSSASQSEASPNQNEETKGVNTTTIVTKNETPKTQTPEGSIQEPSSIPPQGAATPPQEDDLKNRVIQALEKKKCPSASIAVYLKKFSIEVIVASLREFDKMTLKQIAMIQNLWSYLMEIMKFKKKELERNGVLC